jgi:hypothetical protein
MSHEQRPPGGQPTIWLAPYFVRVLELLGDLWICSYPLIAVVLLLVVIFKPAQGMEITRDLGEVFRNTSPPGGPRVLQYAMTIAGVAYGTLAIFFASSSALGPRRQTATVPYFLAALVLLSCFGIMFGNGVALGMIAATVVLFFVTPLVRPDTWHLHVAAQRYTHHIAGALLLVGAAFGIAAFVSPVSFPRAVSTWPIVYLGIGTWTLLLTLVFISLFRARGFPSFWLLPIVVVIRMSVGNDDHMLDSAGPLAASTSPLPTFSNAYVKEWLARHCAPKPAPCTVRFIAAHGGGQRAAYWTQAVLVALHDRALASTDPAQRNFDRSVFAFSGVSGGSLGGLSYYLAPRSADRPPAASPCPQPSAPATWREALCDAASADNLAPIIAAMLYRESLQAFWPEPVGQLDRARVYERGLEDSWDHAFHDIPHARRILDTFPPRSDDIPDLYLNSTVVESGRRFVNGSRLPPPEFRADADYAGTGQPFVMGPIRDSTAAHLSSRFSYVNPHATIVNDGLIRGRLVDGGYSEDTGLLTLLDVIDAFRAAVPCTDCTDIGVEVVYIANNPEADNHLDGTAAAPPEPASPPCDAPPASPAAATLPTPAPTPGETPFLWEIMTPVTGTIDAHYEALTSALRHRLLASAQSKRLPVSLRVVSLKRMIAMYSTLNSQRQLANPAPDWCDRYARWEPPLGWWLSERSRTQMDTVLQARRKDGRFLIDLVTAAPSSPPSPRP